MFSKAQGEQQLAVIEQAIADAEERLQQSMDRLDVLRAKGLSTDRQEKLLLLRLQALSTLYRQSKELLERLKDAE